MESIESQKIEFTKWYDKVTKNWVERMDLINYLIKKNNYKKYLEIGVRDGSCISKIDIEHKDGVDPVPSNFTNYCMTSDEFFLKLEKDYKYDIIFVDGLHHDYQVYRDIINSLNHLSESGIILCHDMNPPFEISQRKEVVVNNWNGDCWKAFVKLRSENKDLSMYTVDTDWGVGIIKRGNQKTINVPEELNYEYLEKNRNEILNLITINQFYELFNS
jgi:hypothetical protein